MCNLFDSAAECSAFRLSEETGRKEAAYCLWRKGGTYFTFYRSLLRNRIDKERRRRFNLTDVENNVKKSKRFWIQRNSDELYIRLIQINEPCLQFILSDELF